MKRQTVPHAFSASCAAAFPVGVITADTYLSKDVDFQGGQIFRYKPSTAHNASWHCLTKVITRYAEPLRAQPAATNRKSEIANRKSK